MPVALSSLVPDPSALDRIATGYAWTEGPLWIPASRTLRWLDIPGDRICQWRAADGTTSVYAEGVEFTNGRALDADGSVVQCSHGRRRVERDRDGVAEALVDRWGDVRLNSPNDVVVAPDGTIWFSDPPYGIVEPAKGIRGTASTATTPCSASTPVTGSLRPVVLDVEEPNGLAFSPDGRTLYVADSSSVRKPPGVGNRWIRAYDVVDGIRCKNSRVFHEFADGEGFPDGIKVDHLGNVWSSSRLGVLVIAPTGERIGLVPVPELVGNLCFGGDDGSALFIAGSTSVYRLATSVRDAMT